MLTLLLASMGCYTPGEAKTDTQGPADDTGTPSTDDTGPDDTDTPADADGDGLEGDDDCDDTDASVGGPTTWHIDADDDGFGDPEGATTEACDQPEGYAGNTGDCDDSEPLAWTDATEVCDGVDNDCNDAVDDEAFDAISYYPDGDKDNFGETSGLVVGCARPQGYVPDGGDCDDANDAVYPGADEVCDALDNDCDDDVDEDATDIRTWYGDGDLDGYGDPDLLYLACEQPDAHVSNNEDCDDTNADAYPGNTDPDIWNDGVDTDCDGADGCGDLDCDGLQDLVVSEYNSGVRDVTDASLFYNEDPGFSDSSVGTVPTTAATDAVLADFDQDGAIDIAFANDADAGSGSDHGLVYWGPDFLEADRTTLDADQSYRVLSDDFDGDGYPDLAFTPFATSEATIHYGSASGIDTGRATTLTTEGSYNAELADLDNDGDVELISCNYAWDGDYSLDLIVFWNDAGTFSNGNTTQLPTESCIDIGAADLDGDGWSDLVVASADGSGDGTGIYWNTKGSFSEKDNTPLDRNSPTRVLLHDLDADGLPDVIYAGHAPVVHWSASGFTTSTELTAPGGYGLAAADFDQDGYDDLAVGTLGYYGDYETPTYVFWGGKAGHTDDHVTELPSSAGYFVLASDLDEDGYPDLYVANYTSDASGLGGDEEPDLIYWGSKAGLVEKDVTELTTKSGWSMAVAGAAGDVSAAR